MGDERSAPQVITAHRRAIRNARLGSVQDGFMVCSECCIDLATPSQQLGSGAECNNAISCCHAPTIECDSGLAGARGYVSYFTRRRSVPTMPPLEGRIT